ncbi:hypothetical protein SAY87_012538 [Trapa incisa]|uniref:VQ domain-containing protein n=1 Tax=Trapa incisa TaxID=236973 RepID=A0AAN7JC72_9MYRT|nr:hypothetical protein SAY87_012538 [Trapa incisa]
MTKVKRSRRSAGKSGLRVVYISSPMKVKTSASEFRAVVQELTGQDSDMTWFMPEKRSTDHIETDHHHHQHRGAWNTHLYHPVPVPVPVPVKDEIAHHQYGEILHVNQTFTDADDHQHRHNMTYCSYGVLGFGTANEECMININDYSPETESPTESESMMVERFDENLFSMPHVTRRFRESHPQAQVQAQLVVVPHELALLDVLN